MRKPDDDLKINISEIFGGDFTPMDSKSDEILLDDAGVESADAIAVGEVISEGNNDLLEKTAAEVEFVPPVDPVIIEEPYSEVPEPSSGDAVIEALAQEEVIDFNAPIKPPFMILPKGSDSTPSKAPQVIEPISGDAAVDPAVQTETVNVDAEKAAAARALDIQGELSFFLLFDECRVIIEHEVKDLVGERKTRSMLSKTFEMAREKYPDVFRNANWDAFGNLLEDGSLDGNRMAENALVFEPDRREVVMDMGLGFLVNLRFQAIEKGLGAGLKNKLRARLIQWVTQKGDMAVKEGKDPVPYRRLKNYLP